MENRHLCELVQNIPSGEKLHVWKPRANHRSASGSFWHQKVKVSERPYYLKLFWRLTEVTSEQPQLLGAFRLDLNGLLRSGYIRSDKADTRGRAYVRVNIFRADEDGRFYLQTKNGEPRLLMAVDLLTPKEIEQEPIDLPEPPARCEVKVSRIIRDTPLARELKRLYGFTCQVSGCSFRIEPVPNTFYIEVHHVRPLGGEHAGTDIQANMLVLCPNHHAMFDYGIPRFLSPQCIEIEGVTYDIITKHGLSSDSMEYHNIKRQNRTC